MRTIQPFHLAVPVKDLKETRTFYREVMGLKEGRSSEKWVDFNLYGHQFVIHLVERNKPLDHNPVDGQSVPVPHFGVVLKWEDWEELVNKLQKENLKFVIEPYVRFKGEVGEQATMFFLDPSGNALEFKAFKNEEELFAKG